MKSLEINLENCYGIKKLENHKFSFENSNVNLIYAKNGSMKTSFAKVFKNIQDGEKDKIKDYIFGNKTVFKIKIDDEELNYNEENKNIFVIKSFDQSYFSTNISSLLFKENVKKKFEEQNDKLKDYKRTFLNEFKHYFEFIKSGSEDLSSSDIKKININFENNEEFEKEIVKAFSDGKKDITEILFEINSSYDLDKEQKYDASVDLKYSIFLNPTVTSFLEKEGVKNLVNSYIEKYKKLIKSSDYFNLKFNHQNAQKILKDLENKYHYFVTNDKSNKNKNSFNLVNKKGNLDEKNKEEIEKEIEKIQNAIKDDKEFSKVLEKLDKKIDRNKVLKFFRDYLVENIGIMVNYKDDINVIKKDLIILYLKNKYTKENFNDFALEIHKTYEKRNEILKELKDDDKTLWHETVDEFNKRFSVPFNVYISKSEKEKSLINGMEIEELKYRFCDGENKLCEDKIKKWEYIDKKYLLDNGDESILSQGEKRAFYLLNIIFEIKQRKKNKTKTLFIIDDIADSFDYKNKYAIVKYLQEIAKEDFFYSIILTHNFDFFRIVQGRILNDKWKNSFIARNVNNEIKLEGAGSKNIVNPFSEWRTNLNIEFKSLIPAIPFIRNLIEFRDGNKAKEYLTLTYVLHQKDEEKLDDDGKILSKKTDDILICDLDDVFKEVISDVNFQFNEKQKKQKVIKVISDEADSIFKNKDIDSVAIGNKIILAIAIRLEAEKFMWSEVSNKESINKDQTGKLFQRYKNEFESNNTKQEILKILGSVDIMTPENIHINSFMYELILDMDIVELKKLYKKVKNLNN